MQLIGSGLKAKVGRPAMPEGQGCCDILVLEIILVLVLVSFLMNIIIGYYLVLIY